MKFGISGGPVDYRAAAFILFCVLAAVLSPWFPLAKWVLPVAFPLYFGALRMVQLPRRDLLWIAGSCLFALVGNTLFSAITKGSYDPSQQTLWKDDHGFYVQAAALSEAWKQGLFVDVSLKGSPPYMGTLHVGYQRILAAAFYLFGESAAIGLALNVLAAVTLPALTALCASVLFPQAANLESASKLSVVSAAALLTALHPVQLYWSGFLVKDLFVAAPFLAALFLALTCLRNRDPLALAGFLILTVFLYTVRAYAALSLLAAFGLYALSLLPTRSLITAAVTAGLAVAIFLAYGETGNKQFKQLWASIMALAPSSADSRSGMLLHIAAGIPRFLLSPYAWLIVRVKNPLYGLYPGMWYLYLIIYPLAFAGFVRAARENLQAAILPLFSLAGCAFILLAASYGGDAPRQRYFVEYVFVLFAAYGVHTRNRPAFAAIYFAIGAFAIGQILTLK